MKQKRQKPLNSNPTLPAQTGNTKWMEEEANQFAMALLMPAKLLKQEVEGMSIDLGADDGMIDKLCDKFQVPKNAMIVRLCQLDLIKIKV